MKKLALSYLLLLFANVLCANNALKVQGDSLYTTGDYAGAIAMYDSIVQNGLESADLYYNLGNAFYKTGDLPNAILHYEKALKLRPTHGDAKYNLELTQQYITDKIDGVDVFFLKKWATGIRHTFTSDEWGYVSIATFILFVLLLLFFTFSGSVLLKRVSFFIGIVFLLISVVGFWSSGRSKSEQVDTIEAIVFSPSVTVKGSPNSSGTELFILHEGTKVEVIDSVSNWKRIKLMDGNVGWLPASAIKNI